MKAVSVQSLQFAARLQRRYLLLRVYSESTPSPPDHPATIASPVPSAATLVQLPLDHSHTTSQIAQTPPTAVENIADESRQETPAPRPSTPPQSAPETTGGLAPAGDESKRNGEVTMRRIGAGVEDMMEDVLGMGIGTELRWRIGRHA